MGTALQKKNTQKFEEYKEMKTDEERRAMLAQYILDPQACVGSNTVEILKVDLDKEIEVKLTEEQLAGPCWLNSSYQASIKCKAMEKRGEWEVHSDPDLSEAGVKVYHYKYTQREKDISLRESAKLTASASVEPDDAVGVMEHMRNSMKRSQPLLKPADESSAKKTKTSNVKASEKSAAALKDADQDCDDPEKKAHALLHAAFDRFDTQRKKLNSAHASTSRKLHEVKVTETQSGENDGFMGNRSVGLSAEDDKRRDREGRESVCGLVCA